MVGVDRGPLKEKPDDNQRAQHCVSAQRGRAQFDSGDGGFAHDYAARRACPVAQDMTASGVASLRVNSPVTRPSCKTITRSESPSTSGNSDEMRTIASPSSARRLIWA